MKLITVVISCVICFDNECSRDPDYFWQWILVYFGLRMLLPFPTIFCNEFMPRARWQRMWFERCYSTPFHHKHTDCWCEEQFFEEVCSTAIILQLLVAVTISQHPSSCLLEKRVSIWIRAPFLECFVFILLLIRSIWLSVCWDVMFSCSLPKRYLCNPFLKA